MGTSSVTTIVRPGHNFFAIGLLGFLNHWLSSPGSPSFEGGHHVEAFAPRPRPFKQQQVAFPSNPSEAPAGWRGTWNLWGPSAPKFPSNSAAHGGFPKGSYIAHLGGSWDLVTTYDWAHKPSYKWLLSPMSLQVGREVSNDPADWRYHQFQRAIHTFL